jgi:phosphatidylethanolamine-binding protein (PEBP) family uncharacterized protein
MSTSRFLAISFLLSTPFVITNCASEEPADDTAAGTGNSMAGTTSGTSGKGGAAGSAGSGVSGSGVSGSGTSGSSGSSSGSAGTATAGTGGTTGGSGGTTGGSTSGGAGAGGTTTAGAGGTTGGSAGAGGSTGGALGGAGAGGSSGGSSGSGGGGAFTLTSSKLTANMSMPDDFTCAGDGHSPPLAWTGAPAGTMSFAMVFVDTTILDVDDTDTRGWHSAIWDMPASTTSLPEDLPIGATLTTPVTAKQLNPLCAGYLGPCAGHEDEYEFRLYALPVATLPGQVNSVINIGKAIEAAEPLGMASLHVKANATGSLMQSCN